MAEKKATVQGEWVHPDQQKQGWGWRMWLWPIGLLGPLIGSIISIVILIAILWGLKFVNVILQSGFITQIIGSVDANIALFFAFFLFTSYAKFFMMRSRAAFMFLHPLSEAVSTLFAAWILGWLLSYTGEVTNVPLVSYAGGLISANLLPIFLFVLVLGYLSIAMGRQRVSQ